MVIGQPEPHRVEMATTKTSPKPAARQLTGKRTPAQITARRAAEQLTGKRTAKQIKGRPPTQRLAAKPAAEQLSAGPQAKRLPARRSVRPDPDGRIEVENVNVPGHRTRVDATKYAAMKRALLKVLPARPPGVTQSAMIEGVVRHLPEALFPGGAKAGWWAKTVQLDLEAKGRVVREPTRPLTWRRAK